MESIGTAIVVATVLAVIVVLILLVEFVVAVRVLRHADPGAALLTVGTILAGLLVGLALSALEWVYPAVEGIGALLAGAAAIGALILTVVLISKPGSGWRPAAVLAAAVLFQIGWFSGRHVLPALPVIGPALEDARCNAGAGCVQRESSSTYLDLRINTRSPIAASGGGVREVEARVNADRPLVLEGTLDITDGGTGELIVRAEVARDDSGQPGYMVNVSVVGPMAGFEFVHTEGIGAIWIPSGGDPAQLACGGTITFEGLSIIRFGGGNETPPPDLEMDFTHATGTLTWDCG